MEITLDTDWGARGAQLTGAQIQSFIKRQFRELIAKDTELDQAVSAHEQQFNESFQQISNQLTTAINQLSALSESCYIAYHRKSDNTPIAVHYSQWPEIERSGEVADGVLVVIDGHAPILVAPTDKQLFWSKINYGVDLSVGGDNELAYADFSGQTRTAAIMARRKELFDVQDLTSSSYAASWCYNYSRSYEFHNPETDQISTIGVATNKWWLPSIAELIVIWKHKDIINRCLALIKDATPLRDTWYWSSTEATATSVWRINMGNGSIQCGNNKTSFTHQTRAITSFYNPMSFNEGGDYTLNYDSSKWTRYGDCFVYVDELNTPAVVKYPMTPEKIQSSVIKRQYSDKQIAMIQLNYQIAQSDRVIADSIKQTYIKNFNDFVECYNNAVKLSRTTEERPNLDLS